MYADDTTQDVSDKCIDVIEYELHRDLINTLEWMNKYKLSINFKKTQGMVICTEERLGTCRNMSIQVDSVIIENMSCAKLLVVYIDKCLTRSEHADILSKKKLASKIGVLSRLRPFISSELLLKMFNTIVFPHFINCCTFVGNMKNKKWY